MWRAHLARGITGGDARATFFNAFLPQSNHRRNCFARGHLARDRDSAYHRSVAQTAGLRSSYPNGDKLKFAAHRRYRRADSLGKE